MPRTRWRLGMRSVSVMSMGCRCTHEQQKSAQYGHPFELEQFAHGAFYHDGTRCAPWSMAPRY
jgi:hypothetical protein